MALKASKMKVGDTYTEKLVEDLKRTQIVQYAGASGDYNPVHTDGVFATQVVGYPSTFAHGMLTMGMTGKMLTNYVGDGRLAKYGVRFTPTFQFFPERAGSLKNIAPTKREVTRAPGYFRPDDFLAMFRYVREKAYESKSFREFLKSQAG